ncbi:hypothetical protein [Streptomyces sp. AC512_CC834]|uniref:hypothetical protein n=1 Tax=Streptomyces sp. AC512_CC834 TaxID=2823691 RepID=UPI001C26D1A1|nr:hypothetical protein [Streptomyces sp. AC512_CC834]
MRRRSADATGTTVPSTASIAETAVTAPTTCSAVGSSRILGSLRVFELRYGSIRAEALPSGESVAFIEQLLGET